MKKEAGRESSKKLKRALDMIEKLLRGNLQKSSQIDDLSSTGKEETYVAQSYFKKRKPVVLELVKELLNKSK